MTTFTINGTIYESNEKGNYFYKSTGKFDKKGNAIMMRIPRHIFEQAQEQAMADAEREARLQKQAESDKAAEDAVNGKKPTRKQVNEAIEKETKKASKPRKSKDIAHESNGVTLTAKQVDFMKEMTKTNFWENGLESALWCDILADEIGGQFANKPMTVGAMISTLREKSLVRVMQDRVNGRKCKFFELTELGKEIAKELGLN